MKIQKLIILIPILLFQISVSAQTDKKHTNKTEASVQENLNLQQPNMAQEGLPPNYVPKPIPRAIIQPKKDVNTSSSKTDQDHPGNVKPQIKPTQETLKEEQTDW